MVTAIKFESTGGAGFGVKSSIGMNIKLSKVFSIYTELNNVSLSYAQTSGKITEATYNGIDRLHVLNTSQKEFEYVDKYVEDTGNPLPTSIPSKSIKEKNQFSSFGVNLGIRFNF